MMSSLRNLAGRLLLVVFLLACFDKAHALPAFARKYGLRCSACHEAWPMLNYFGQKFKDNGYQLMNDRDSPIWQNPSYWPATFRITPYWHRESADKVSVDATPQIVAGTYPQIERTVTSHGFDLSGLDFHTGGTLEKKFSFYVLPSSDSTASFHFETVMARLDNLAGSSWLNIKLGKFELDNLVSEKRILTLTSISGVYQTYHFLPVGDANIYGQIGDNQLGLEYMGHSADDRTRVSAALLSTSDGNVNLASGANAYSGFFTASQAFDAGKLGVERVGMYAMVGSAPITFMTSSGVPVVGTGSNNKDFYRVGYVGQVYLGNLDFLVVTQHGYDNAYFGQGYGNALNPFNGTPGTGPGTGLNYVPSLSGPLPATARAPTWNGYMVETHYVYNPQLIFIQRSEWERVSQQADTRDPSNLGNIDMYTFGFRWYPIMNPRAGFAFHNEYSWLRGTGLSPVSGTDQTSSSLLLGFDFDF